MTCETAPMREGLNTAPFGCAISPVDVGARTVSAIAPFARRAGMQRPAQGFPRSRGKCPQDKGGHSSGNPKSSSSRFTELAYLRYICNNLTHKANAAHERNAVQARTIPKGPAISPDPAVRCRRAEAPRPLTVILVEPSSELDVRCVSLTGIRTSTCADARSMTRNGRPMVGALVR